MKRLFAFFLLLFSAGCSAPDPFPEKKDAIYLDMVTELGIAEKGLAEARKTLEENQAELEKVIPQTGRIHFARKRLFQTQNVVALLEQQKKYWTVRVESRRNYIRKISREAFSSGKDQSVAVQQELNEYKIEKTLRSQKLNWDVRARLDESKKSMNSKGRTPAAAAGGHH